jgi:hypothetical protein
MILMVSPLASGDSRRRTADDVVDDRAVDCLVLQQPLAQSVE